MHAKTINDPANSVSYCSLCTFSVLALVFFVNSHVSFCLQICWTEDTSLTRNRFSSKAICDQIRLCHPCGVLMLKCGYVQLESSQSYESSAWQADSSGLTAKPIGFHSLRFGEAIPANAAFEKCWNCILLKQELKVLIGSSGDLLYHYELGNWRPPWARWTGVSYCNVWGAGYSFTGPLAVSRFGIGVSWFMALVIVASWACYCSLRQTRRHGGFGKPPNSVSSPQNWNMKNYKSVEFCQFL